ncbi:MAG: TIR domain-containing protein [Alistipes sp.]|nr:TIR domain-containing protein [Alistipes sp.]
MAYDIFISYRRDGGREFARPLKAELELRNYNVFLDFDELKDGVFDRRIMDAIDSAPIFLVVLSPHSLDRCADENDWVRKEIEYAMRRNRHVIPINPDLTFAGFPDGLPAELKAGLGQHQFSEVMFGQLFKASVAKMVGERIAPVLDSLRRESREPSQRLKIKSNAACRVLIDGEWRADAEPDKLCFIPLEAGEYLLEAECAEVGYTADRIERDVVMGERDKLERLEFELLKTYEVGDYYDENGKEGVVFEVDATGRHGKIVSMKQSAKELRWCTKEEYDKRVVTGATDCTDGMKNMQAIRRIAGWREKYPAFAWCAEQGDGWYLPAIEELEKFTLDKSMRDAVNGTLSQQGGDKISTWYWSSSENDKRCAWCVLMYDGYTDYNFKSNLSFVRAVSAF